MRFRWPEDTVFQRLVLDVEQECCRTCGQDLHICDHRIRHIYTLEHPLELCCRLVHCADPACPSRPRTFSPAAELSLALPGWLIGWDVFCFIGHRRFARHWSIPQIRNELSDAYAIRLSPDALANYIHHYQNMLAARQQDFANLQRAYQGIDALDLTIDGLQPEKGHETEWHFRSKCCATKDLQRSVNTFVHPSMLCALVGLFLSLVGVVGVAGDDCGRAPTLFTTP